MSEISNITLSNPYAAAVRNTGSPTLAERGRNPGEDLGGSDPVEFSRLGRMLADQPDVSSLRLAKIQALRQQIADGTFETPERIAGTVDRLLKQLVQ